MKPGVAPCGAQPQGCGWLTEWRTKGLTSQGPHRAAAWAADANAAPTPARAAVAGAVVATASHSSAATLAMEPMISKRSRLVVAGAVVVAACGPPAQQRPCSEMCPGPACTLHRVPCV